MDHSTDKTFRSFIAPDLLILDDLGLHRMTQQQSIDLYELVIARHRTASFVITSNRAVDEWLGLFDRPHPRQQRPRPARLRQLPDRHRRRQLPRTLVTPQGSAGRTGCKGGG